MLRFDIPVPLIAAVLAQVPAQDFVEHASSGVVAAVFGAVALTLWYLKEIGKLPGASGERRSEIYTKADRTRDDRIAVRVDRIHEVVAKEETSGWPLVWGKESRVVLDALVKSSEGLIRLREHWIEDRQRWEADRQRWEAERGALLERITRLEDTVRQGEMALKFLEGKRDGA